MNSTLNHLGLNVSDKKSFPFYKELLSYLGYELFEENEGSLAMITESMGVWLHETHENHKNVNYHRKGTGLNHIAFRVDSKENVDKFYNEFLKPRGIKTLYGTPKHFPEYTDKYYAVFFEDPDRIKLEVMFM